MKKDIVWLDFSRFIGIFLVVFCHSLPTIAGWDEYWPAGTLWDYIYLFHMPLFFFVSGYLYRQGKQDGLKRVWLHLIVPYILYLLLSYLSAMLVYNMHHTVTFVFLVCPYQKDHHYSHLHPFCHFSDNQKILCP